MSYSARISQANRQTIIFLIDQSGSMNEQIVWNNNPTCKADAVSQVVNCALNEIIARCNHYGNFKSYFNIAALGYGGMGVRSLLGDGRQNFYLPAELAYAWKRNVESINVRTLPNGKECVTKSLNKIWIESVADGRTPMLGAFNYVFDILVASLAQVNAKNSFPPLIINITDGEATDCSLVELALAADNLKALSTNDGNTLLMNVHIANCGCQSLVFPSEQCDCPLESKFAKTLFDISSTLPCFFEREISMLCNNVKPYKAFAYNASISDLVRMINIGSSSTSLIL